MLTQEQLLFLLSLLNEGKLPSELVELLTLNTDNNYLVLNNGLNDAKKIKVPLLRGYKGTYNASTNTPTLTNGVGLDGDMYVVGVAGTRDFGAGTVNLLVDDIVIYLNGKYLKTNGITTGGLDLQGTYNNSSPKTITVLDVSNGALSIKDSATNSNRDEIIEVLDTSGNIIFYVRRDKTRVEGGLEVGGTLNGTDASFNSLMLKGGKGATTILKKYSWRESNSSNNGTVWKKVCQISIPTGTFKAVSLHVLHYFPNTNHGGSASLIKRYYSVSCRRSGNSQDNTNDAIVYGLDENYIRVVKTATGEYELQARANENSMSYAIDFLQTSGNPDSITVENSITDGNTTGTIYTASSNSSTIEEFPGNLKADSFIKDGGTSSQFLKADGSVDSNLYALVGALSTYLPLTGGTLTGSLNGTDASFSGSLGIGTNSPSQKLEVNGNVKADKFITGQLEINSDLNATNIVSDDENLYIKSDHTSGNVRLIADAAVYLQTGTNEDLAITASSSSGVGLWHIGSKKIGTTTTGASVTGNLEVSGTILTETNNVQTITGTTSSETIGVDYNVVVVDTSVDCTLAISVAVNIASIKVINVGTGNVYFSAGTGVTVNDNGGHIGVASSNKLYFSSILTKIATNSWIVSE